MDEVEKVRYERFRVRHAKNLVAEALKRIDAKRARAVDPTEAVSLVGRFGWLTARYLIFSVLRRANLSSISSMLYDTFPGSVRAGTR